MCCIYDINFVSEGRNAKTLNLLIEKSTILEFAKYVIIRNHRILNKLKNEFFRWKLFIFLIIILLIKLIAIK